MDTLEEQREQAIVQDITKPDPYGEAWPGLAQSMFDDYFWETNHDAGGGP